MTFNKLAVVAIDIFAAAGLVWFAVARLTGAPMEPLDWLLLGYLAGVVVATITAWVAWREAP